LENVSADPPAKSATFGFIPAPHQPIDQSIRTDLDILHSKFNLDETLQGADSNFIQLGTFHTAIRN
jgi:hypothetical protein